MRKCSSIPYMYEYFFLLDINYTGNKRDYVCYFVIYFVWKNLIGTTGEGQTYRVSIGTRGP